MALQVTLYTRPGCSHCQLAREYLKDRGVDWKERNVADDPAARAELERMHAPGLPVIVVGQEAVLGFDKIRLDDLLKSHGVSLGPPPEHTII